MSAVEDPIFEKYARETLKQFLKSKRNKNTGQFSCAKKRRYASLEYYGETEAARIDNKNSMEAICQNVLSVLYELIVTGKKQAYNNIINDKNLKDALKMILQNYTDEDIEHDFDIKDKKRFNEDLQKKKFKILKKIRDHVTRRSFFNNPTSSFFGGKRHNTRRRNRKSNKTRKYKSRSRR